MGCSLFIKSAGISLRLDYLFGLANIDFLFHSPSLWRYILASSTSFSVFPLPDGRRSLKVPWNNPILAKDSTYPIQEEWNISNAM